MKKPERLLRNVPWLIQLFSSYAQCAEQVAFEFQRAEKLLLRSDAHTIPATCKFPSIRDLTAPLPPISCIQRLNAFHQSMFLAFSLHKDDWQIFLHYFNLPRKAIN